jgi:hypothetical protein
LLGLCGIGVVAALGLILQLRALPGPSVAMALPLQSTSGRDSASLMAIVASTFVLFGLAAFALPVPRVRFLIHALVRSILVAAWALAIQAVSLQLTNQAAVGFDWGAAASSTTPWLFGASAFLASAGMSLASPNRRSANGPTAQFVDGSVARAHRESLHA